MDIHTYASWNCSCAVCQSEQDVEKGSAYSLLIGKCPDPRHEQEDFCYNGSEHVDSIRTGNCLCMWRVFCPRFHFIIRTQPLGLGLCMPCVTHHHPHILACQHKRAILEHQAHETGIPARQLYLPQCQEKDGSFDPIQCHPVTRQCWCVDSGGDELPGTRAPPDVQPSCAGTQSVASALEVYSSSIDQFMWFSSAILPEHWNRHDLCHSNDSHIQLETALFLHWIHLQLWASKICESASAVMLSCAVT
jgi:hypothetical protein